jgi:hypothetical protein
MPTLRITIDIFSGRPNPVIELSGKPAREVLALLKAARTADKRKSDLPPVPTLGYRGLLIEDVGARPRTPIRTADQALEDFICGSTGLLRRLKVGRDFPSVLRKEIERFRDLRHRWPRPGKVPWPVRIRCRCAPLYEPAWWNDGGQKQLRNNCYNYASNYRTDTFNQIPGGSQPGAAAGAMYTQFTCASVRPAAVADGLIARPSANNRCPGEGHLVALVIAPGIDFHWYRKGRNGYWSHKPGSTPVINLDNSNHLIPDPRTADRGMYTQFCTFMVVMHGHIKIR